VRGRARAGALLMKGKIVVLPGQKADYRDYHPAMSSAFGGPAPIEMSAHDRAPSFGLFIAEAELPQTPPGAIEGLRVAVTITGRAATFGERAWRSVMGVWRARTSI
jgi:hypothetical protein